ncbi:hypothetical protein NYZ23_19870, partial [Acinetobacter baumannii]|nr:hypothetical protein [Acinetobacter baumannii]
PPIASAGADGLGTPLRRRVCRAAQARIIPRIAELTDNLRGDTVSSGRAENTAKASPPGLKWLARNS